MRYINSQLILQDFSA